MTVTTRLPELVLRSPEANWNRERWEQLPDDGNRYEVIDGVLYMTTAPSFFHQWIIRQLALALIRQLNDEAIQFVESRDLITIPPLAKETWRMEMMSPERQLVNPFFTGGETISVSYPVQAMTEEQKLMSMRGNNIHFSRA